MRSPIVHIRHGYGPSPESGLFDASLSSASTVSTASQTRFISPDSLLPSNCGRDRQ